MGHNTSHNNTICGISGISNRSDAGFRSFYVDLRKVDGSRSHGGGPLTTPTRTDLSRLHGIQTINKRSTYPLTLHVGWTIAKHLSHIPHSPILQVRQVRESIDQILSCISRRNSLCLSISCCIFSAIYEVERNE